MKSIRASSLYLCKERKQHVGQPFFTCASQYVTYTDDEQYPGGGRGPGQGILSQSSVSFAFRQKLQDSEHEAQSSATQTQRPEQDGLEGDHKLRRRVSVRTAEGLQTRGRHDRRKDRGGDGERGTESGLQCQD